MHDASYTTIINSAVSGFPWVYRLRFFGETWCNLIVRAQLAR
jgi:hypothetical protein